MRGSLIISSPVGAPITLQNDKLFFIFLLPSACFVLLRVKSGYEENNPQTFRKQTLGYIKSIHDKEITITIKRLKTDTYYS